MRQQASLFAAGAARRIYCHNGLKDEHGSLVVSQFDFRFRTYAEIKKMHQW
jgi:hypothetical protein